jgi:flagellar hook-length control protein FliK
VEASEVLSSFAANVDGGQGQWPDGVVPPELLANGGGQGGATPSTEVNLSVETANINVYRPQPTAPGGNEPGNSVAVAKLAGVKPDSGLSNQPKKGNVVAASVAAAVHEAEKPAAAPQFSGDLAGRHQAGQKTNDQVPVVAADQDQVAGDKQQLFSEMIEKVDVKTMVERQTLAAVIPGHEQISGGAEKSLPVTSNDVLNQVTMQVPDKHDRRQTVTIQLQPESLGKVEVKLVMEHQKLTAHFIVQHSEVRDVLLKHVTSLHDALSAKGIDVKQVAVEIAPAEKTAGMAVSVDQHSTGGSQTGSFQQFAGGEGQSRHAFATRDQSPVQLIEAEKVTSPTGLTKSEFLQPGSLHIRA